MVIPRKDSHLPEVQKSGSVATREKLKSITTRSPRPPPVMPALLPQVLSFSSRQTTAMLAHGHTWLLGPQGAGLTSAP